MTPSGEVDSERDDRLNAVLLKLVKAMERGETPDRKATVAAHPEFAADLEEFFAGRDCLARLASNVPASPAQSKDLGTIGDFRLLRELGRGEAGIVYEAQQLSLDRRVALKVLPSASSLDARQWQRFQNEAHAAALLHHPNIVRIHSVGCSQGVHFCAMQFIPGQSLAEILNQSADPEAQARGYAPSSGASGASLLEQAGLAHRALGSARERSAWRADDVRAVARLGIAAAEALEHAHQHGIVHRGIKPANLLVDQRGQVWITDFGVGVLRPSGTLRYLSPEQAGTGFVDHRTDVYSLGATLYELLTRTPLFAGSGPNALLRQIANEEPVPPRKLKRNVPAELEVIVLKALAKIASERYATAQEFADDLRRFLEGKPIRATRPNLAERMVKWSLRHPRLVVTGLALVVLANVGLLIGVFLIR